jgi:nitronate monooxygenase
VGVNLGTRFLASKEAPIEEGWQNAILNASSEDTIKADVLNAINPLPGTVGYRTVLRALRSDFIAHWNANLEEAAAKRDELRAQVGASATQGGRQQTIAGAGQIVGAIRDVLPVAEIIQRIVSQAESVLGNTALVK